MELAAPCDFAQDRITRPDVRRGTPFDEQIDERRQHIFVVQPARDDERKAFPAGLVDDGKDAEPFDKLRRAWRPSWGACQEFRVRAGG